MLNSYPYLKTFNALKKALWATLLIGLVLSLVVLVIGLIVVFTLFPWLIGIVFFFGLALSIK